jgi:hypothetical protein
MNRRLLIAFACAGAGLFFYFAAAFASVAPPRLLGLLSFGIAIGLFAAADRLGLLPEDDGDSTSMSLQPEPPASAPQSTASVLKPPSQHVPPTTGAVLKPPSQHS